MTHKIISSVFVIHEAVAVREAMQGGNAAINSMIIPILVALR